MISYSCGCKYKTDDREEAVGHVAQTGHTMTAHGVIRKVELFRPQNRDEG